MLRPLIYGVTTILTLISLKYQYGTTTTQIWWYHHFHLLISPQLKYWKNIYIPLRSFLTPTGHYYSKKGLWSYWYSLFRRDLYYRRDYVFKTILNSEGTLNRKGTMVLRTLLIPKGQKKEDEEKKDSSTQVKKGRREKEYLTTQWNSLVYFFELTGVLYLYRDSVTILAKIATTVTLMDKIKMEFIH